MKSGPMVTTPVLRARLLAALAGSSLVAGACGGKESTDTGSTSGGTSSSSSGGSSSSSSSGSSGSSGTVNCGDLTPQRGCYAPADVIRRGSNYGGVADPDAAPLPPPVLDPSGCPVQAEVMNGCCNPAASAPTLEGGKCCYTFCGGACCGRPLRTPAGDALVADVAGRSDWSRAVALDTFTLDATTRAALARDWLEDARLEHASIASFAIFAVELLGFAAPPDLVTAAQSASLDEVEHARTTFAIASAFEGAPLGPSALPLGRVAPSNDLATVAAACVRDGCIGETIASLVAEAQARNATSPGLRDALARIAEDEGRHAELAWRFVAWATARGGDVVRDAVAAAFATPRPAARPVPAGVTEDAWRAGGRLTPAEHDALVARAENDVLGPCRDALAIAFVPAQGAVHVGRTARNGACGPTGDEPVHS